MRFLRAAWDPVVRIWDWLPIRLPGLVLIAGGLFVAFRIGRAQADYLLYPAGLLAVGLVGLCLLVTLLGALALWRSVRKLPCGIPDGLETTYPARTRFRFPRLVAWPLVESRMRWHEPASVAVDLEVAGRFYEEVVTPRERGRHARVVRRFTVEDIFGLTSISFRVTWNEPLRIVPASAVAGADLAASYAQGDAFSHPAGGQEGDLVEMRRYGAGDSMRHILWKTFARTRRLLVRMPERAIAPRPITVAFLIAGAGDEPTAAAARLYLEKGWFGPDFLFAADGATQPTRHTHEAVDQIIESIACRASGGATLSSLAAQVESSRLSSCVVFAPPVDGPWRDRVTSFSRRLASPATVIIGVDGVAHHEPRGLLARLLLRPEGEGDADGRAFAALPHLRAALEAEGVRVQVIHRKTGQVL